MPDELNPERPIRTLPTTWIADYGQYRMANQVPTYAEYEAALRKWRAGEGAFFSITSLLAQRYWQLRPSTSEIDFMVPSQADADRMYTELQRYYMNPATHTPVEPAKPVEDPFLNHYL